MTQALSLPGSPALADRLSGTPLVVMLDVDGTLAPIAPRPDQAVVPAETRRAVAALAATRGADVVLVSGRAAADARRMVAVANVWVIGNHGFETVSPDGEELVDPGTAAARPGIAQAARRIAAAMAHVPGVILEDKGWTLSVHYRLADPAVIDRLREHVADVAAHLGLRVTEGKKVLEVRPATRVDKGTAVLTLAHRLGGLDPGSALVFIGDDRTDEDAFRALRARAPSAVTIRVLHDEPQTNTSAEFALRDPAEVRSFLEWLREQRR